MKFNDNVFLDSILGARDQETNDNNGEIFMDGEGSALLFSNIPDVHPESEAEDVGASEDEIEHD